MKVETREEKLKAIISWSQDNAHIRAVLLTSSLVNPGAPVDEFSDLDIEFIFEDNNRYVVDNSWVHHFGHPIAMVEEDESCFDGEHAMKMVLYDDYVKVDFKLYSKSNFLTEINQSKLCEDWDIGYKVLVDKEGLTREMKKPTYQVSIIKKPQGKEFQRILNDFWWDTTYVAKSLIRDNIFYAKFMSENNIRTDYLKPLIEWYIASEHDWNITTNKHGRLFKQYLTPEMWKKVLQTFSGEGINDNWNALFAMADLVTEIGTALSERLGYEYPTNLDADIRKYLNTVRKLPYGK
ncbi:AadS family aminoglycoside 6-adenylyltransferase [Parapedobacter indicus]|uniref:Aminoglycoside 6-adenylyltransferase n=1 Tax=Parapedobacter indicus TaxID=1477437 RepID=A0A1I3VIK2_9SPHI|nr:AadS family aminoglycoside 6-adenylyltransferase [Parapedobacter indicus]PPK98281.1 aminoglycoside 6-adenylyltransferase [Parapedobacter indicus]SFJ95188.1 aminoglycoside 6-adenylyltransferase [Parapedobacter indicus]